MSKATYETDCEVIHMTEEAMLLSIDGDKYWVPKNCIENIDDLEVGEGANVEIHEWFAIEAGIV